MWGRETAHATTSVVFYGLWNISKVQLAPWIIFTHIPRSWQCSGFQQWSKGLIPFFLFPCINWRILFKKLYMSKQIYILNYCAVKSLRKLWVGMLLIIRWWWSLLWQISSLVVNSTSAGSAVYNKRLWITCFLPALFKKVKMCIQVMTWRTLALRCLRLLCVSLPRECLNALSVVQPRCVQRMERWRQSYKYDLSAY